MCKNLKCDQLDAVVGSIVSNAFSIANLFLLFLAVTVSGCPHSILQCGWKPLIFVKSSTVRLLCTLLVGIDKITFAHVFFLWYGRQWIVSRVCTACRSLKIRCDRQKFLNAAQVSRTVFQKVLEEMQQCAPVCASKGEEDGNLI